MAKRILGTAYKNRLWAGVLGNKHNGMTVGCEFRNVDEEETVSELTGRLRGFQSGNVTSDESSISLEFVGEVSRSEIGRKARDVEHATGEA